MFEEEQAEEFGIEFLEEDADIVQQCVQNVESVPNSLNPENNIIETQLLVERVPVSERPRKRKKKEDDSDYDPSEDIPQRGRKKRQNTRQNTHQSRRVKYVSTLQQREEIVQNIDFVNRRNLVIKIPNYDDPLCLPVRATLKEKRDSKKLKMWNDLCLEHYKNYDIPLRAEGLPTVSSKRLMVFRNIQNKVTGQVETTLYSKLSVENENGDKKSEVVQSVLPKYREKNVLSSFQLSERKKSRTYHYKDEVLLTREAYKDSETLVVYKPRDKLSLVYKMFEKEGSEYNKDDIDRRFLQEVASCKVCAPCYQTSWRGYKTNNIDNIKCHVCRRPCVSMYSLLSHLKSHSETQVRAAKRAIVRSLASVMNYHYKCRICQQQFLGIKDLRHHVQSHKGLNKFKCEVGNHVTT